MTEPTDALLPCPFCGEAAKHSFNSLYGDMSMASCKSCGATAYAPKWNRRAVLAKWGQPAQPVEREPLSDDEVDSLCKVGPVYAPDGKVTLTPPQYRYALESAQRYGLRKGERAHGIKKRDPHVE